jgi:hypothetical protein
MGLKFFCQKPPGQGLLLSVGAVRGNSPRHPWGQLDAITITRPTECWAPPPSRGIAYDLS